MILDEIAAKTKERIARCKEQISFEEMKAKALAIVEKETENGTKPYMRSKKGFSFQRTDRTGFPIYRDCERI